MPSQATDAELDDLLLRFVECFKSHRAEPQPPAAEDEIERFESRYHVRLPADYRGFLLHLDGNSRSDMDEYMNSFWKLSEVETLAACCPEVAPLLGSEGPWFVIADHSIGINYLLLDMNSGETALVFPEHRLQRRRWLRRYEEVSEAEVYRRYPSFTSFLARYLDDAFDAFTS